MKARWGLAMGLALAGLLVLLAALNSGGATAAPAPLPCDRYVLGNGGSDAGNCSNMASPCHTVQYAINHAADNDVICVADRGIAPGPTIYAEHLLITRTLTLEGAWKGECVGVHPSICTFEAVPCAPELVVLDGFHQGRVITIRGAITPTIDCFTIRDGNAAGWGGDPGGTVDNDAGGGIYSLDAAPIIVNNVITGNYGCDLCPASYGRGGGVYLLNAPATAIISGNVIARNVADNSTWGQGGGIMLRDSFAQVRNNAIRSNRAGLSAGYGGGIAVIDSAPQLVGNEISGNVAGQAVSGLGGGIFIWTMPDSTPDGLGGTSAVSLTPVVVEGNRIFNNSALTGMPDPRFAGRGGGVFCDAGNVPLYFYDNTLMTNNAALVGYGEGGALYLYRAAASTSVVSNTFTINHAGWNDDGNGGGLYLAGGAPVVAQNLIDTNYGSANDGLGLGGGIMVNEGAPTIAGNTITGNYASLGSDGYGAGVALSATTALVQDNWITLNCSSLGASAVTVGGGVYVYLGTPHLVHNQILTNTTGSGTYGFGGGVYVGESAATLDRNTIIANTANGSLSGRGGGARFAINDVFTFTNNIVARNEASDDGSGLAVLSGSTMPTSGQIAHNTIVENRFGDGVGVWLGSYVDVILTNNIILNQMTGISNTDPLHSTALAQYTLFESNGSNYGSGVISVNPVSGPAALMADYHLSASSHAINAATPLSWVTRDVDGDPRPVGPAVDVGADEYVRARLFLPLVLREALP